MASRWDSTHSRLEAILGAVGPTSAIALTRHVLAMPVKERDVWLETIAELAITHPQAMIGAELFLDAYRSCFHPALIMHLPEKSSSKAVFRDPVVTKLVNRQNVEDGDFFIDHLHSLERASKNYAIACYAAAVYATFSKLAPVVARTVDKILFPELWIKTILCDISAEEANHVFDNDNFPERDVFDDQSPYLFYDQATYDYDPRFGDVPAQLRAILDELSTPATKLLVRNSSKELEILRGTLVRLAYPYGQDAAEEYAAVLRDVYPDLE